MKTLDDINKEIEQAEKTLQEMREYNSRATSYIDESRFGVATAEERLKRLYKAKAKWEDLLDKMQDARRRLHAQEDRVKAAGDRPPQIGDEYLVLPLPEEICMAWLVIHVHPDESSYFFCVPTDSDDGWIGVCDVLGEGSEVARCGLGLWLPAKMLELDKRVDVDRGDWARRCRKVVADMVRCKLESTPEQEECEDDPVYREHQLLVGTAVYHVEQRRFNEECPDAS